MALTKTAAKFENPENDAGEDAGGEVETAVETKPVLTTAQRLAAAAAEHAASVPAEEAKPAPKTTALAPAAKSGVMIAPKKIEDPLAGLKNSFHVEYNTLRGMKITNGNVVDIDTSKALGDTVGLELLSYQDSWVISPGVDGKEAGEFVRYSDDGITTSKGDDCKAYLAELINVHGFGEAAMTKRTVICGALFDAGKGTEFQGKMIQISLPPTSKSTFDRYCFENAYNVGKGLAEVEGSDKLRLTCSLTTKGKNTWTVVDFSRYG